MSDRPGPGNDIPSGVTTGSNSLWSRLVKVETDVASLREHNDRTWDEVSKLRAAVHPMASSLTTLTMLTERAEEDRGRIIASIDRLADQLPPLVAVVQAQGSRADAHIRECDKMNAERLHDERARHADNVAAIGKIVTRLTRVEYVYYIALAAVLMLGALASPIGQRVMYFLSHGTPT